MTDSNSSAMNNRPELALLLAIARVELLPDQQSTLSDLLAGPLDWEYLLSLAYRHGLEPLLFLHLHSIAPETVPASVMQTLRENCKVIAGRNLILANRLKGISAHLSARQIDHIAYKGPLLAETYYGSCTLRVFHDLDLLVKPSQVVAARAALAEIGFRDKYNLSAAQQAASFRFGFEHPFTATGGADLDLHWRVVQKFKSRSLDMEGIWKRATMAPFLGGEAPAFCPEDLMVALCLHAGHHGWMQLSHMCDIAQIFRACPRLDWGIVSSHLGDSNTRRLVYVSLHLLRQHWSAEIPADLMARITADPHVSQLAHRIQTEIWPAANPALTTSGLRWMLQRSAGEEFEDRLRLLAGSFFCPAVEDIEAFRLPAVLASFYPALRVLRLAYRFVASRQA